MGWQTYFLYLDKANVLAKRPILTVARFGVDKPTFSNPLDEGFFTPIAQMALEIWRADSLKTYMLCA
jgi:hypothetical protein